MVETYSISSTAPITHQQIMDMLVLAVGAKQGPQVQ